MADLLVKSTVNSELDAVVDDEPDEPEEDVVTLDNERMILFGERYLIIHFFKPLPKFSFLLL